MTVFLFGLVASLILIPIIYLIPLGLSKTGQHLIFASSVMVAFLSILMNFTFDWWQSILVYFLLLILVALVIVRRFEDRLFLQTEEAVIFSDSLTEDKDFSEEDVDDELSQEDQDLDEASQEVGYEPEADFSEVTVQNTDDLLDDQIPDAEIVTELGHDLASEDSSLLVDETKDDSSEEFFDDNVLEVITNLQVPDGESSPKDRISPDLGRSDNLDQVPAEIAELEVHREVGGATSSEARDTEDVEKLISNRDWALVEEFSKDLRTDRIGSLSPLDKLMPEMDYLSDLEKMIHDIEEEVADIKSEEKVGEISIDEIPDLSAQEAQEDSSLANLEENEQGQQYDRNDLQSKTLDDDVITPFSEDELRK